MNQKHIFFPCSGIFSPLLCPKNYPSFLFPPLLPTTPLYLLHLISHSLPSPELRRTPELEWHRASRRRCPELMSLSSTKLRGGDVPSS